METWTKCLKEFDIDLARLYLKKGKRGNDGELHKIGSVKEREVVNQLAETVLNEGRYLKKF